MKKANDSNIDENPSDLIDARIAELGDWGGKTLATIRRLIKQADPARLFNASLDGNARRAIDLREGDELDESAFKALIREAVALNQS